jgi:hypothetical protein
MEPTRVGAQARTTCRKNVHVPDDRGEAHTASDMRVAPSSFDQAIMTTPLDRPIKRELELDGTRYTVTISPEGIKVTEKGKRKGQEITWRDIISGDAALRRDLKLSVQALASD